ncbi:peptide/nickel transport system substrate-binding protein [Methylobacterium phyllostachyos]|uniref:Peptide/nickel transport system substrate-binding protein n=1 Tax=Methylobacterium phyllostachyos TaxID=582672 RepID=A0A1G9T6P9_9HYPH|nr:peptide/nickel transport system substrate-binding protein [Methylobacterium phyllostachyos]
MLTEGVSLIDSRSDRVVMEPNPTYWNPARRPTVRIVYDNVIGKDAGIASVASGDGRVDVVFDLTPAEAKAFPQSDKGRIQTKKAKTILTGVFNENKPGSVWRDPAVRRALNLAIDRQFVLDQGAYGYGTVIPAFIQPGRFGADPGMSPLPHDPEAARAHLEKAGLGGREIVIVSSPAWKEVVEAIGQCLSTIGLSARFVSDRGDLPEDFDIKLEWYFDWTPQYPVACMHREFFGRDATLRQGPEDPEFDALYEKLLHAPEAQTEAVVREVERYIQDRSKALFLYAPFTLFAVSERVAFTPYDTCMSELAETRIKG